MGIVCVLMLAAGLVSLVFCMKEGDSFETFALLVKLATATATFLAFQYLSDIALLLLVACLEAQFDSFNALRHELRQQKRKGRTGQ